LCGFTATKVFKVKLFQMKSEQEKAVTGDPRFPPSPLTPPTSPYFPLSLLLESFLSTFGDYQSPLLVTQANESQGQLF